MSLCTQKNLDLLDIALNNNEFIHTTFVFEYQGILHNLGDRLCWGRTCKRLYN